MMNKKRKLKLIEKLSNNNELVQLITKSFLIVNKPVYRMICLQTPITNEKSLIQEMIIFIKSQGVFKISKNYSLNIINTKHLTGIDNLQLVFKF